MFPLVTTLEWKKRIDSVKLCRIFNENCGPSFYTKNWWIFTNIHVSNAKHMLNDLIWVSWTHFSHYSVCQIKMIVWFLHTTFSAKTPKLEWSFILIIWLKRYYKYNLDQKNTGKEPEISRKQCLNLTCQCYGIMWGYIAEENAIFGCCLDW